MAGVDNISLTFISNYPTEIILLDLPTGVCIVRIGEKSSYPLT